MNRFRYLCLCLGLAAQPALAAPQAAPAAVDRGSFVAKYCVSCHGRARPAAGVAFERPNTYGAGTGVTYDPEALKVVWERVVEEAGIEVLLHTWATGVQMQDRRIHGVRLWNKGGESVLDAGAVVDASGDADLCAMAGVPYDDARSTPNLQSLSSIFRVANVDMDRAAKLPNTELWALMRSAAESGRTVYRSTQMAAMLASAKPSVVAATLMTRMTTGTATATTTTRRPVAIPRGIPTRPEGEQTVPVLRRLQRAARSAPGPEGIP